LSQIELRILAHLSQDPVMLAVFRGERRNPDGSKVDLHAALAERIFGVKPKDQDDSLHRLPAKAVNFGLPMGMTEHGLMLELRKNGVDVSVDDAARWIDETMKLYAGVRPYQQGMITEAWKKGYVRCLSGRVRYIGGIRSGDMAVRAEAERFAFSTPIQEGAQWLMKQAEASIWKDIIVHFQGQRRWTEPLLQVHDAITLEFEADPALARDVNARMVGIMTRTPRGFSVPVETSGDWGTNMCKYKEKAKNDPSTPGCGDLQPFKELLDV
jgi:DNA polymerase-1